jgi:hypothetical protein
MWRTCHQPDVADGLRVFPAGVPSMVEFRADLKSAGIAEVDGQGRRVVFHSLRHTLATNLSRSGVAPRAAQDIMRHSEIRLTMQVYTDASMLGTADAIEQLPRFQTSAEVGEAVATGTDAAVGDGTQIGTQKVVSGGPVLSAAVSADGLSENENRPENPGDRRRLSDVVRSGADVGKSSAKATLFISSLCWFGARRRSKNLMDEFSKSSRSTSIRRECWPTSAQRNTRP